MSMLTLDLRQQSLFDVELGEDVADLIITGIPVTILENRFIDFITRIKQWLKPTGTFLIDGAAEYSTNRCYAIARSFGIYPRGVIPVSHMYHRNRDRYFHVARLNEDDNFKGIEQLGWAYKCNPNEKKKYDYQYSPAMIHWIVENFSNEGDTVLDPCCGSESIVPRVSHSIGRHGIGVDLRELNEEHIMGDKKWEI